MSLKSILSVNIWLSYSQDKFEITIIRQYMVMICSPEQQEITLVRQYNSRENEYLVLSL